MNTRSLFLLSCVLAVACATGSPQQAPAAERQPVAASSIVDRAGDAVETAIEVPADAPEEGVRFENDWIFDRIGRFRRTGGGTGQLNGRRYDIVEVENPKGEHFKYFFDITENWKNWRPQ